MAYFPDDLADLQDDDEPALTNEFDLLYVLTSSGWSVLHVVTSGSQISVPMTHVFSDPTEDLCGLCCELLRRESARVHLYDEPGQTVLTASVFARQKHLTRIQFWKVSCRADIGLSWSSLLKADLTIRRFVGLLYRQFEKERWLAEEKSYARRRRFPHAAYERLERLWRVSSQGS